MLKLSFSNLVATMNAIYGKKIGMTRVFGDKGTSIPVTVLECKPNVVYQVKTVDSDGYEAVQVGIDEQKPQRLTRAMTGHCAVAKSGMPKRVKEIRLDRHGLGKTDELKPGSKIDVSEVFEVGNIVDVLGVSTGKGFAGVMKRHGMKGQPATHGTHEAFRHGGSIGNRKFPGRVFKNKRMGGHMGAKSAIQEGLTVVGVRAEDNALLIRGSVPGPKNQFVLIRKSVKSG